MSQFQLLYRMKMHVIKMIKAHKKQHLKIRASKIENMKRFLLFFDNKYSVKNGFAFHKNEESPSSCKTLLKAVSDQYIFHY